MSLTPSWVLQTILHFHKNRKHHFSALLSAVVLGTENFHSSKWWSVDSFFRWAVVKSCWVCCCRILFVQEWWAEFCYQLRVWNGLGIRSRNLWFQRCLESLLLIFVQDSIHQGYAPFRNFPRDDRFTWADALHEGSPCKWCAWTQNLGLRPLTMGSTRLVKLGLGHHIHL